MTGEKLSHGSIERGPGKAASKLPTAYGDVHTAVVELLETARLAAARSVNALMTASYWEIGRRGCPPVLTLIWVKVFPSGLAE